MLTVSIDERDRGQGPGVELGDRAFVLDRDPLQGRGGGELADEIAELTGEPHVGAELGRVLGAHRRHVDGVDDRADLEIVGHLLGDLDRDLFLGLGGRSAQVRRRHHLLHAEQQIRFGRLLGENVERGAGDVARLERRLQVGLDHQPAAGAIDDEHAFFHLGDRAAVDDGAGRIGQGRVEGDEVGAGVELVELDLFDAERLGPLGREVGIVSRDFHVQADRAVGDDRADIAAADDAEALAVELDPHEARLLPLAGVGRGVGGADLARDREQERDRVLGGGDGVAERGVHDHDALLGRGGDVDVVDADAGAADDAKPARTAEDLGRHLGRRAHREAVIISDRLGEIGLGETDPLVDLDAAGAEDFGRARAQGVRDQDFRHGNFSRSS